MQLEKDLVEEFTGFKTQQEIWTYLVNGGYVLCGSQLLGFYEGSLSTFNIHGEVVFTDTPWFFTNPEDWSIGFIQIKPEPKPEPKWYDNIPEQGVLCWCKNLEDSEPTLCAIVGYIPEDTYKFQSNVINWKYAEPATLDELTKYVQPK